MSKHDPFDQGARALLPAAVRDHIGYVKIDERRRWTIWLYGFNSYRDLKAIRMAVMALGGVVMRFIPDPAFQERLPLNDDRDRQRRSISAAFAER